MADLPPQRPTVALDLTPLVGPRTGVGRFVAELLTALERLDDGPAVLPYVLSRHARPGSGDLPAETRRLRLPASVAHRWWAISSWPAVDRRLRPAGVVHGTNFVVPPTGRAGAVVTVHDCAFVHSPEVVTATSRRYATLVGRAVRRGAWVHTPSEAVAAEVRAIFGAERVRAVPHGVRAPVRTARPHATPGGTAAPYVLFVGSLDRRKRADLAADAFGLVAPAQPDLRLVVVGGDGPGRPDLDAAVARLAEPARRRVECRGYVTDAERQALLEGATALVHPSAYEGFGLPVLEAMAAGVPVVATAADAVVEVAGAAARLVEADADALAGALVEVLGDDVLRASLVMAGRERAARFTWEATAAAMAAGYRAAAR